MGWIGPTIMSVVKSRCFWTLYSREAGFPERYIGLEEAVIKKFRYY